MLILNLRPAGSMLIVWFKDKNIRVQSFRLDLLDSFK